VTATELPFATFAERDLSVGGNAQEADFKSKMQCFGAVDSG